MFGLIRTVLNALFFKSFESLASGVVELAGLAYLQAPAAEQ